MVQHHTSVSDPDLSSPIRIQHLIYSGFGSDFGNVAVPVPVQTQASAPVPDTDNIKHSFSKKFVQNLAFYCWKQHYFSEFQKLAFHFDF
jgi:hypothetical protein